MLEPHVEVAVRARAECGEGPLWDPDANAVHWVDILAGKILTTDYLDGSTSVISYPQMVGAAAPRAHGGFVGAVASGFVAISQAGITQRIDCLPEGIRMNDAKVDPAGRYWAGSCAYDFAEGKGGLWRLDQEWNAELILSSLTQPNGLGWSPDGATFYLVETQARTLHRYHYDALGGVLDPSPDLVVGADQFPPGLPDGLAVDSRGHLWITMFGGSAVHEFTPEGELVRTLDIPTLQTTSCMFVGPDLDELWVTSAADGLTADQDPHAGSIFRVTGLGVAGLPVPRFGG
ncbi:MAG: SMP-30/gluconolactonase/LRE family protein [Beutenbergiaceae bacterium]